MDANLPAEASVGMLEIGIMGYYSQRRIIDFAGILQPEVAGHGRTYGRWAEWAIRRFQPSHLCIDVSMEQRLTYKPWFSAYRKLRTFNSDGMQRFTIYERSMPTSRARAAT